MTILDADIFPSVHVEPGDERHLLLWLHNKAEAIDDDAFAKWYCGEHWEKLAKALGEAMSLRVYNAAPAPSWAAGSFPWDYMTLIELDGVNPAAAAQIVRDYRRHNPQFGQMIKPDNELWAISAIGPQYHYDGVDKPGMDKLYFALTNPIPEEREQFHKWYETAHVPEVIEHLPEYVGAQRFIREQIGEVPESFTWEFITIYNVETSDVIEMQENIPVVAGKKFQPLQSILPDSAACTWTCMSGQE